MECVLGGGVMNRYTRYCGRCAALTCSVFIWLSMPAYAMNNRVTTGDIIVKVDAAKESAKTESQSTTIITKEDITQKQAKSVEDIIFSETGMARNVDAMGRVTVSMRGAEPRHTLILIDGQPVMGDFAKYSGQADELQRLGTENVERIEIIRGAASAKYGADAIGGVINVITKSASKNATLRLNLEGRRIKEDNLGPPYKNFFLRADSGNIGKFKAAIYGGKRDIMPIYSAKLFYNGINTVGPIRNSLRYFGDIKNLGILGNYTFDDKHMLDFSFDRSDEGMSRFTKHSVDAPDPVVHYKRDVDRDTYHMGYKGHSKSTDWKVDFNYTKMQENDITLSSVAAFSQYEGKNTLRYLDHILHKEWNVRASANTAMNERHLLTYGVGFSSETGEGSRLKSARNLKTRYIDPWDYDKNLYSDEEGIPSSDIKDRPMYLNDKGIPQYDKEYALYGYKDAAGKTQVPPYTFEDYENGTNDDKIPLFIDELRRENPANLFLDEDGDPLDDDTIMRRYYGDYNRTLTWHGKKFEQEEQERKNRQTMGQAEIKKHYIFLQDFWQLGDNTAFMPSIRFDHSTLFGSHVNFNLGLTHSIHGHSNQRVKANIGTGYTEPGMGELYYNWEMYAGMPYDLGVGKLGYYWFGNPNLKPEKSLNFDLGYEAESGESRIRVNLFHNKIRDYMTTYFTGELMHFHPEADAKKETWITPPDMIYSFKNIGKAEITGLETEFSQKFGKYFSAKLGYTYLHAINKSDPRMPRQLLNKPKHKIDIGLTYENMKSGWRASLWGDYYLQMLDSNTIANDGNYVHNDLGDGSTQYSFAKGGEQTYQRKTFGIWNFLVQKKFHKDSIIYVGIDNLFNHRDDDQATQERVYKFGVNLKFDSMPGQSPLIAMNGKVLPYSKFLEKERFITTHFNMEKKRGINFFGDYRVRYNSFTGKNKPTEARVTSRSSIGSAYKNYLEKSDSGIEQRVRIGADMRIGTHTNLTLIGSASGTNHIDTAQDVGDTRSLAKARIETADLTQHMKQWDISLGRLSEYMGTSGYWFGKEYDGVRAVWTNKRTQVRLGVGDFRRSTGISDSAYTHTVNQVFLRAPTKKEWLGYDPDSCNDEVYTIPHVVIPEFESLYDRLEKTNSLNEEKKIFDEYFKVISKDNPLAYEKIKKAAQYETNSHLWRIVTAKDAAGNVKGKFLMTDLFMTVPQGANPFDQANLRDAGEASWSTVMARSGENTEEWRAYIEANSGLLKPLPHYGRYTFTSEFYGYGVYTGTETLEALGAGSSHNGKDYAGIPLDKLKPGDFMPITKEEAKERAITSLFDKKTALQRVYKKLPNGERAIGYRPAMFTPVAQRILALTASNSYWRPEDNSSLPLHLLEKAGYLFPQLGAVLQTDTVPGIKEAVYLQARREVTPKLGVAAWYLRSLGNSSYQVLDANGNDNEVRRFKNLANVVGVGAKYSFGKNTSFTIDYGQNRTEFGRYLNGVTRYTHAVGTSDFTASGRERGGIPSFWVLRFDIGKTDTRVPHSWSAFIDYKAFSHGAFFGGNGTEALPDRYLDGIRSFTVGTGYVPTRNFLVEAFYTFGAKGIGKRDTLYGTESFRLGDYTRIQATYRF